MWIGKEKRGRASIKHIVMAEEWTIDAIRVEQNLLRPLQRGRLTSPELDTQRGLWLLPQACIKN